MTRRLPRSSRPAAVVVRLVAFVFAALGIMAIPATLVAATVGHLNSHVAFFAIAGAALLVVIATLAAQSVDPLRG